jgi:3',5'-cyclic AMP phosphodiesterase CpdA
MKVVKDLSQRKPGRTVIAHISDLHFTGDTNTDDWILQALQNSLAEAKPDLLFVTGDLIDGSVADTATRAVQAALTKARLYVESLCGTLHLDPQKSLFVVPGNHDYRIKGLLSKKSQAELFRSEFGKYFEFAAIPGLNAIVFMFDSNSTDFGLNLASGYIERERFTEFERNVLSVKGDVLCNWYDCTKIALLHHHPMPIGPTEHRLNIADRDEFLLLKNAGLFMQQMVRSEIHLVFHGHKHYPSLSKAIFPSAAGDGQSIAVIAAGSVRNPPAHFPRSFNVVTMYDGGKQELERRVLHAEYYERHNTVPILTYDQARSVRYRDLAKKHKARVQAKKYVRCDSVEDGSGDLAMHEEFRGVRSYDGELVESLDHSVKSRSGRFGERHYDSLTTNQKVEWKWTEEDLGTGVRKAKTVFQPPVKETPIDFDREGITHNAIHFSQQDRLSATGHESKTEHVSVTVLQAYESLAYQLLLPPGQWPPSFMFSVLDERNKPNYEEAAYCEGFLTPINHSHSVVLTIDRPLVGHTYRIEWDLPHEDKADDWLGAQDAAMAEEIIHRLLAARDEGSKYRDAMAAAVQKLATVVDALFPAVGPTNTDLEITIFCYDKAKEGLVCVVAHGYTGVHKDLWGQCIKPGRRIDGQAYRRRESVLYVNIPGVRSDTAAYYEEPKTGPMHRVVCSVPLFYPLDIGKRVAVVSLGTRSNTSGLLQLSQSDEGSMVELVEQLNAWFAVDGAQALGLELLGGNGETEVR